MARQPQPEHILERRARRYPTDMLDDEWEVIAPYLAAHLGPGARRTVDIRAVVDAIWYRMPTGCQWRRLPSEHAARHLLWPQSPEPVPFSAWNRYAGALPHGGDMHVGLTESAG